jgi:hypothetical protein
MKSVYLILISMLLILLLDSCVHKYKIEGKVDLYGYEGLQLNLVSYTDGDFSFIDSCKVYHGQFKMDGIVDDITFAILCRGKEPILPLYLEKGEINVNMKPTQYDVDGTEQNELLYGFLAEKRIIDNRYEETVQKKMSLISNGLFNKDELERIDKAIDDICVEMENLMYKFITENFQQKVSVGVFSMLCNSDNKTITPLIKRILDHAPKEFLKSPYVESYANQVGYELN